MFGTLADIVGVDSGKSPLFLCFLENLKLLQVHGVDGRDRCLQEAECLFFFI